MWLRGFREKVSRVFFETIKLVKKKENLQIYEMAQEGLETATF